MMKIGGWWRNIWNLCFSLGYTWLTFFGAFFWHLFFWRHPWGFIWKPFFWLFCFLEGTLGVIVWGFSFFFCLRVHLGEFFETSFWPLLFIWGFSFFLNMIFYLSVFFIKVGVTFIENIFPSVFIWTYFLIIRVFIFYLF